MIWGTLNSWIVLLLIYFEEISAECMKNATSDCIIFDDIHVKTFDGNVYSFNSSCDYKLISMDAFNLEVNVLKNPTKLQVKYAGRTFEIVYTDTEITLTRDGVKYTIPQSLNDVTVSKPGKMVITEIKDKGIKIRFDGTMIEVIQNNDYEHPMRGLCGDNDGCASNDLIMADGEDATSQICFANSWALDSCLTEPFTHACGDNPRLQAQAVSYCTNLLTSAEFSQCLDYAVHFRNICTSLYCSCKLPNRNDCMCDMLDAYVKTCQINSNLAINWRTPALCYIQCASPDQSFTACHADRKQLSCGEDDIVDPTKYDCEEGCYCPSGMRLFQGECLFADECPCFYNDNWFKPGISIAQECNTCTCRKGIWECTNKICTVGAECNGDPHYTTFDGKRYDFMGKCTYYVVRGIGFDIMCDHYVYNGWAFVKDFESTKPSYCAKVIIQVQNDIIELEQNHVVKVNGEQISWLPHTVSGIRVTNPSSSFTEVVLRNYVTVTWNGHSRLNVKIPTSMKGRVRGLFGTYNTDQLDDFTMPDGTLAPNANIFGHSWAVSGSCSPNVNTDPVIHPCEQYPTKKPQAEKSCGIIKSSLFAGCSDDVENDYEECVYDGCLCPDNDTKCLCDFYAQQGEKCTAKGILINWRETITDCAIQCPKGQIYQVCSNSCERSCEDISANPTCSSQCVDGCNCPPGETLNNSNECIPIGECPCVYDGTRYPADFTFVNINDESKHVCQNGLWNVTPASNHDMINYMTTEDIQAKCSRDDFLVFAGCKQNNELTCMNKHLNERPNYDNCESSCQCMEGFLMDTELNMCVRPEDCPCMYKGISYPDNAVVNDRSQKCICVYGFWECEPQTDHWEKCSVWGNVHVRTFDETIFSFNGLCEYILFEHTFDTTGVFRIKLQTDKCSSGSCIAAAFVYYRANDGHTENVIFLTGNDYITSTDLSNLKLIDLDVSTVIDVDDLDLRVVWNKAGWIHIHISQAWITREHVGLCGKYDNDASNDLEIPEEESSDVSDFVNNNAADNTCGGSTQLTPIDAVFPGDPCNVLYSDTFKVCRMLKPVDEYFKRCIIEAEIQMTLTPEQRTDHHCDTISAYAQECNDVGTPVVWRTEDICPYNCAAGKEYSSCDTLCSKENCENTYGFASSCREHLCSEACSIPECADDEVYKDSTYKQCVERNQCFGKEIISA